MTTEKLVAGPLRGVREAVGRAVGNFCGHTGELNADGNCPKCELIIAEVLEALASLPSSPPLREALGALVAKWRKLRDAFSVTRGDAQIEDAYDHCADDLEASLASPVQALPGHLPDEWEMCAALMQNDQLEQLLSSNWKHGESPASNVDIPELARGVAKLIYESRKSPVQGVRSQEWLDGYAKAHSEHPPQAGQRAEGAEAGPSKQCFNCGANGDTQFVSVPLCADCVDEMKEVR